MSWRNKSWQYLDSSTHADPAAFQRRQRARAREAEAARRAQEQAQTKVTTITKRRAAQ